MRLSHVHMSALPFNIRIPIVRCLRLQCVVGARYCSAMATGGPVEDGAELTKVTEERGTPDVSESKTTKETKAQVLY